MDYKKIYDDLCNSRKHRLLEKEIGYEIHHILPRSMGGTDEDENLVKLTYREHFIAHLLLSRAYPNNIGYKLACVYFLKRPDIMGSRTYQNIKCNIERYKRYQRYLSWSSKHINRLKLSSFYDKNSEDLKFHKKYIKKAKDLISNLNTEMSPKNLKIHLELLKLLTLVREMGYKGLYGWQGINNRSPDSPAPKYAFNKIKKNFISLGILDIHGDFVVDDNPLDSFESSKGDLEKVLKSDIEVKLAIKGMLNKWNFNNKNKTIAAYKAGSKIVLEPITPFLEVDFKYNLEIFKPITYRKAKEILEYLNNESDRTA